MKQLSIIIFLFFQFFLVNAQELVLNVENIKSNDGQLIISLFANSDDFLKKPVYEKYIMVGAESMTIVLKDVPEGYYALCVIHDQNGNGDMDTNILKIPKEAYGFSHNPKSPFGPPKFTEAKFGFHGNLELTVNLN